MRTIIRFVLGAIAAVNLSFIWTVGQTGLSQTNKNLCELWASMRKAVPESLPGLPEYQNCEFERLLVYGALAASAAIISWFAIEVLLWALKRRRKASQQDTELRIGMTMRELQAQHEQASALREHTEELRRQREAEQRAVPLIAQRPRLKCSFSMHDTGCIKPNTPYNEVLLVNGLQRIKQTNCTWFRLRVDAEGGNITDCHGRLISIKRGGAELLSGENPPLPFTHSSEPDGGATIHEGVSEFLDLLGVLYDQRIALAVPLNRRSTSIHWEDMFSLSGSYEIKVAITAPSVAAVPIELVLHWNLQPNTAKIEIKNQQRESAPLQITVGSSIDFYDVVRDRPRINSLVKLFKIRVENMERSRAISGVRVLITGVSTMTSGFRFPWVLADNLQISAGDHEMIPFAKYEEWREPEKQPSPIASDTIEIVVPQSDRFRLLGIEEEHVLQVRCTGIDVPPADAAIKLSVTSGRIQIERI